MIEPRLASKVWVNGLLRLTGQRGGFGTVLHRGDDIAGTVLVLCVEKGANPRLLERMPSLDGIPNWQSVGPQDPENISDLLKYVAVRQKSDPDLWAIELDIADAEQLVADFTPIG